MPTILVADDNSNIQKMATLALKDLGVVVVAVGNGEAAIRKLPDLRPDLILADIFMPGRNGYEVCEFVKRDERFAHIPVILLKGSFDPLDEHEVKRVRAHAVLQKPFVPPEPLIEMVKAVLKQIERARATSETQKAAVEFAAAVPTAQETQKLSPEEVAALTGPEATQPLPEPEAEEFAVRQPRVEFGEGESPLAFGELLGTAPAETEAEAEAVPEAPSWGGIELEPRQPAPDEPPIPVEFGPSEPLELITDDAASAPLVEAAPLPELVGSGGEWGAAVAAPSAAAAAEARVAMVIEQPAPPAVEPAPEPTVAPSGVVSGELPGLTWSTEAPVAAEAQPAATVAEPAGVVQAESFAIARAVDPALVDAVVEKVIERLQPQILELISREILRPLAEALLRRELEKQQ